MAAERRPDRASLESVFNKYATVERDGKRFMSEENFVCDYLQLIPSTADKEIISVFSRVADTTGDSLVSFEEFAAFESLLRRPDAATLLSFRLFDVQRRGIISFENFQFTLGKTSGCKQVPFDFDSNFIKMYFGPKKSGFLDYFAFVQLLQNLPTEHAKQAFVNRDKEKTGSIPALEFVDLIRKIRQHKLSSYVDENLLAAMRGEGRRVNYAYFKAFNQLLNNVDLLEEVMTTATESADTPVTMEQVQMAAQRYPQITPLQISLMFNILSSERNLGYVTMSDFNKLLPENRYATRSAQSQSSTTTTTTTYVSTDRSVLSRVLEGIYRFGLAGMGGATGATAVYPIDLVKTRMQNQRGSLAGEIMYNNSFDCAAKVVRHEGFFGLYRGLLPQLLGVTPEKAIKLTVNDTVRDLLTDKNGELPLWKEIIAGGCGGASQVTFTNPIEIVKIRLQVAGEMGGTHTGVIPVLRELGFLGLYKGASACLLRDIPFSAIYFPTYAHMKEFTADKNGHNGPTSLFISAFIAGVPSAGLLTPADVIKTRLQVKAREGQQTYRGLFDCARTIYRQEGGKAFWKGAPARVFRSSPQFGVTLLTYELLQRLFPVDFGGQKKRKLASSEGLPLHKPDLIGGYSQAYRVFTAAESQYGLVFSKPPISGMNT